MYATTDNRRPAGSAAGNQYGTFAVKFGADPQVRYAKRLVAERDVTGITIPSDLDSCNKKHLSDLIDKLLIAPVLPSAANSVPLITDKQRDSIVREVPRRVWSEPLIAIVFDKIQKNEPVERRDASKCLDVLFNAPFRPREATAPAVTLEDAMYLRDGVILKVYHTVHGANQQVAKRLCTEVIAEAKANGTLHELGADEKWEYLGKRGLVGLTAEHRMTLEQAKDLGAVYGVCIRCAATLTNEVSIEAQMGPVCRGKFA